MDTLQYNDRPTAETRQLEKWRRRKNRDEDEGEEDEDEDGEDEPEESEEDDENEDEDKDMDVEDTGEDERRKDTKEVSDELFEIRSATNDGMIRATVTDIWQKPSGEYVVEAEWGLESDPYTYTDSFERTTLAWSPEDNEFDRLIESIGLSPGNIEHSTQDDMDIMIDGTGSKPEFYIPPASSDENDDAGFLGSTLLQPVFHGLSMYLGFTKGIFTFTKRGVLAGTKLAPRWLHSMLSIVAILVYAFLVMQSTMATPLSLGVLALFISTLLMALARSD